MSGYKVIGGQSGGGGAAGNLVVGPDYGSTGKHAIAIAATMPASVFGFQRTITLTPTLPETSFKFSQAITVTPSMAAAFGFQRAISLAPTLPATAFGFARSVTLTPTLPATSFGLARSITASLAGSYLGAPNWLTVGVVASSSSGTSIVIPKPSGLAVGDLMLAFCANQTGIVSNFTLPTGFTEILNTQRTGTLSCTLNSSWKIADSADVAASNFTFTSSEIGGFTGCIHRINATDATTPINVSAGGSGSASDPVAPTATTTANNCLIFVACMQAQALDASFDPPATYTERTDQTGLGIAGVHSMDSSTATRVLTTAGATGTATFNSTAIVAADYAAQTIAISTGALSL